MKNIILTFLTLAFFSIHISAQVSSSMISSGVQKKEGGNQVYSFLAESIQDKAFKGNWSENKTAWLKKLGAFDSTNIKDEATHWSELVSNMKPAAFDKSVKPKMLIKELSAATDRMSLNKAISKIGSGLKADYLSPEFAQNRDTFLNKLGSM